MHDPAIAESGIKRISSDLEGTTLSGWIAEGAGKWSRPLRFLGERGFVEVMRLMPGASVPLHRHTGEAHALTLSGQRRLGSGEEVGAGEYTYEPPGHVDAWEAVGDSELLVLVIVMGEVHYIDACGTVTKVVSSATRRADLERYRQQAGIAQEIEDRTSQVIPDWSRCGAAVACTSRAVVLAYIQALDAHDYRAARAYLDDSVLIKGPAGEAFRTPEDFVRMMAQFPGRYRIKRVFTDGEEICVLYDFVTEKSSAFFCSWYHVSGKRIRAIQTIFDPRALTRT